MKSKFSTAPIKIPIIISDALGGVIIPDHEILMVAQILGFIKSNKGWHQIPSIFGDKKMPLAHYGNESGDQGKDHGYDCSPFPIFLLRP